MFCAFSRLKTKPIFSPWHCHWFPKNNKSKAEIVHLLIACIMNDMKLNPEKKSIISLLAAGLLSIFARKKIKHTQEDLKKAEFKTSTQRLGIRFNEKIRDVFRFRWIRKRNG